MTSAANAAGFPCDRLAEVALVGRSNVGKSSLINALVGHRIARTSAAPGKTRLANFYRVAPAAGRAFYLVDLPGYGYARGGDPAADEFRRLAEEYFGRVGPQGAVLVVDSRHPGLEADVAAWEWLASQPFPAVVAGSKVDKLTRAERARHSRQLESSFAGPVPLVSAHSGEGLEELWKKIVAMARRPATAR